MVRDLRFRQALNKAINYDDIVETVYFGFAKPPYTVPGQFDPEGAKKILDQMGLDKRDAQGFRLGPDGKRFTVPIEIAAVFDTFPKVAEMVAEFWKVVGIDTTVKVVESGLLDARAWANELYATLTWPLRSDLWWAVWAPPWGYSRLWGQWIETGGAQGEEPPPEIKQAYADLTDMFTVAPDDRAELHARYIRNLHDNLWQLITAENIQYVVMTNKRMGNVATKGFGIAAQFAGEQYFFKP